MSRILVGPDTHALIKNLTSPELPSNKTYEEINTYLNPKRIVIAERFKCHNACQSGRTKPSRFYYQVEGIVNLKRVVNKIYTQLVFNDEKPDLLRSSSCGQPLMG